MKPLPLPLRVAAGLAVKAAERARELPKNLVGLPVTVVSQVLQFSMRMQQQVTELAIKGDEVLSALRPVEDTPSWATFDEDLPPVGDSRTGHNGHRPTGVLRDVSENARDPWEQEERALAEDHTEGEFDSGAGPEDWRSTIERGDIEPVTSSGGDEPRGGGESGGESLGGDIGPIARPGSDVEATPGFGDDIEARGSGMDVDAAEPPRGEAAGDFRDDVEATERGTAGDSRAEIEANEPVTDSEAAGDSGDGVEMTQPGISGEAASGLEATEPHGSGEAAGGLSGGGLEATEPRAAGEAAGGLSGGGLEATAPRGEVGPPEPRVHGEATGPQTGVTAGDDMPGIGGATPAESLEAGGLGASGPEAIGVEPEGIIGSAGLANYDELTLPQLRARLRRFTLEQLEQLLAYERAHENRPSFVGMLARRIGNVRRLSESDSGADTTDQ